MKIGPYLFLFYSSALVLLILLRTDAAPANSSCGADDCVAEEFDEFLMESEVSRRILAGNQAPKLSYRALEKAKTCNAMIYGNCVGKANPSNRPCTLYTRCKRSPG